MHIPDAVKKYLGNNGFRVLKTKADRLHPDERHLTVVSMESDPRTILTSWKLVICKETFIRRYSIGKAIWLNYDCTIEKLDAAIKEVESNVETLGTVMKAAFEEANSR